MYMRKSKLCGWQRFSQVLVEKAKNTRALRSRVACGYLPLPPLQLAWVANSWSLGSTSAIVTSRLLWTFLTEHFICRSVLCCVQLTNLFFTAWQHSSELCGIFDYVVSGTCPAVCEKPEMRQAWIRRPGMNHQELSRPLAYYRLGSRPNPARVTRWNAKERKRRSASIDRWVEKLQESANNCFNLILFLLFYQYVQSF